MTKVKVGFIGCGGIAQYHFGHFERMPEKAQIVATCDLREERARAAAERFQATPYVSYQEMFAQEELDALFVCIEPSAHDGMELIAIEKGIHLFVQKPMTLDMKYARKVLTNLKKKKLISAVGLQCRYADTIDVARRWVSSRPIGMISCHRLGGLPMVWWWRVKEHSGGQAVEQTIHDFDLCRYLFGEVSQVQAICRRGVVQDVENYDVEDASSTLLTFENGMIGTFSTGCFGRGAHDVTAYARNGSLTYGLGGSYTINEPNMTITGKASNDYGQECDETFIDAIRGEIDAEEIMSPYADAIKSLALVLAINKSMDQGGMTVKPEM